MNMNILSVCMYSTAVPGSHRSEEAIWTLELELRMLELLCGYSFTLHPHYRSPCDQGPWTPDPLPPWCWGCRCKPPQPAPSDCLTHWVISSWMLWPGAMHCDVVSVHQVAGIPLACSAGCPEHRMGVSVRLGRHKHETWTLTQHLSFQANTSCWFNCFSRLFLLWTSPDLSLLLLAHCRCRLCALLHPSGITDKETLLTSHPFLSSPPVLSCLWAQCWSFSILLKCCLLKHLGSVS